MNETLIFLLVLGAGFACLLTPLIRLLLGHRLPAAPPAVDIDAIFDWETAGENGRAKVFLPPIPARFQIYMAGIMLAGISFRKRDALAFAHSRGQMIERQREPDNSHDPNAIQIYGVCSRGREFVGYVPKADAAYIARSGMFAELQPRLDRMYLSFTNARNPYLEIRFQILGPKGKKAEFQAAAAKRRNRASILARLNG
jgi:HIRAN domain